MEISPRVHSVEDVTGSNVVLLADKQMAVVDTGLPGNGDAIVSYIRKIGRSPSDLRWILLTHFHIDHAGSAAELHELTGAQIVAHKAETETGPSGKLLLRQGSESEAPPLWYRWIQRLSGGRRGRRPNILRQLSDIPVHETVEDGDVIPCLAGVRINHSPGHTPGSICPLLMGPKVLFLGDSVINNVDRLSRPLMWSRSQRRQLDTSLCALRDLEADLACFGHGPPLSEDVMGKLRGLTDQTYDLPTWRIAFKNWRTLRRWQARTRRRGHWEGGKS